MEARRNTVQRQIIIEAVERLNTHATATEVVEYLIKTHPAIGRATIYRNLSQMADAGELLRIDSFHGATHYDHNCHPHYHFECNSCGKIFDVEGDISNILEQFKNNKDFDITECNVSFKGVCWDCK